MKRRKGIGENPPGPPVGIDGRFSRREREGVPVDLVLHGPAAAIHPRVVRVRLIS